MRVNSSPAGMALANFTTAPATGIWRTREVSCGPATSAASTSKRTVVPKKRQSWAYSVRAKVPARRPSNAANSKLLDIDSQSIAHSDSN